MRVTNWITIIFIMIACAVFSLAVTSKANADYEVIDLPEDSVFTGERFDNTDQQLEREQVRIMREQLLQEQRRNIQEQQYLINQQFQRYPSAFSGQ